MGPIRVSSDTGNFSATHCASCGAQILTTTEADGHVALRAGDRQGEAFLHADKTTPDAEGSMTVVLPPQKFGLRNPHYANAPQPAGVSDADFDAMMGTGGVPLSTDLLFRPDGTRRPDQDISAHIGKRGLWQCHLAHEIALRLAGPPPMTMPPKIFLSYRWQDEGRNAWVADLASTLKARGYDVMFDRDLPQTGRPNVPQIVSRVAECRYFLAVVDPGYLARIGDAERMEDGWVFDEFQAAVRMSNAGMIRLLGFLREGEGAGRNFRLAGPGVMGNMVDVRGPQRLAAILDQVFPPIEDVTGTDCGEEARAALDRSHAAFVTGDIRTAVAEARKIAEIVPTSPDGYFQMIRIAHRTGDQALGFDAAMQAVRLLPTHVEVLLEVATFSVSTGRREDAARHAALVFDQKVEDEGILGEAHAIMAWALDEYDRPDVALGHARSAVRLCPDNSVYVTNLGFMLRRLGDPVSAARVLSDGMRQFPEDMALMENYASAVTEAGLWDPAESLIMLFYNRGGSEAVAAGLARAVKEGRETGKLPVMFTPAVPPPGDGPLIGCDACGATVRSASASGVFCAACGTPAAKAGDPCTICGDEGWMMPMPADVPGRVRCPFCRDGGMQFVEGENTG